jgi:hypothetical protein
MIRKKKEEEVAEAPHKVAVPRLSALNLEFGREDLNALRDKINELISHFNER